MFAVALAIAIVLPCPVMGPEQIDRRSNRPALVAKIRSPQSAELR